jgi:hypothetical protein
MKDLLQRYCNIEISAIQLIRALTGIINPDTAIDILALVNQIARLELGDLDLETFKQMYGLE